MEKKELSFTEKVEVAGDELKKAIKDGGAVILIASEVQNVKESGLCYLAGSPTTAKILLAGLAYSDTQFRKILESALKYAEWKEQMEK